MKKLSMLIGLLALIALLLLLKGRQEKDQENVKNIALKSYKILDSIAQKNYFFGKYYIQNKKTWDEYIVYFYRNKEGTNFSLTEFHNDGTFIKPRMEVSFVHTPETSWEDLSVISTDPDCFYQKKYEIKELYSMRDMSFQEQEKEFWIQLDIHLRAIIKAIKGDSNFIFRKKKNLRSPKYYSDMEDIDLMIHVPD